MKESILLIGGGGHAAACIDVIHLSGIFAIAGIVDPGLKQGTKSFGYPVLGGDTDLPILVSKHQNALITVGQIKNAAIRVRLFAELSSLGFNLPIITSPLAHIANSATLAAGTIIMHFALINAYAQIGKNCIINSKATIEHECCIGDHCHIAVGAILCGNVTVEEGSFFGD